MIWIVVPLLLASALFGIHRLALWAEQRGWVYYRDRKPGAYGAAFIHGTSMFAPETEHVVEEQQSEALRADTSESGDPASNEHFFPGSVDSD